MGVLNLRSLAGLIRHYLVRDRFKSILENSLWLLVGNMVRVFGGGIVGILVARYLGPSNFGVLNYVFVFFGFLLSLGGLGMDYILPRMIPSYDLKSVDILFSAIFLRLCVSVFIFCIWSLIWNLFSFELSLWIFFLVGFSFFVHSFSLIRYWYEAKIQSKIIVKIELFLFPFFVLSKFFLIYIKASVNWFVAIIFFEMLLVIFIYMYFFLKKEIRYIHFQKIFRRAKRLFFIGLPFSIPATVFVLHLKFDQIFLTHIMGFNNSGLYAAAVRIFEIVMIFPVVLLPSLTAILVRTRSSNSFLYHKRLELLFSFLFLASYVSILGVVFFSERLVLLLYGNAYFQSAYILSIYIFSTIGMFQHGAMNFVLSLEKSGRWLILKEVICLCINIVLNLILIPIFGFLGAAIATVVSYGFNGIFINFFNSKLRWLFFLHMRSLFLIPLFQKAGLIFSKK